MDEDLLNELPQFAEFIKNYEKTSDEIVEIF